MKFKIKLTRTMVLSYIALFAFALMAGASDDGTFSYLGIIVVALLVVGIIAIIVSIIHENQKKAVRENLESTMDDFTISEKYLIDNNCALYYDAKQEKVKFVSITTTNAQGKDIPDFKLGKVRIVTCGPDSKFYVAENKKNNSLVMANVNNSLINCKDINNFSISQDVITEYSYFAVDEANEEVLVIHNFGNYQTVKYNDIMKVEIIEDGISISSKSALRTIGGAVVGNIVAGGAGMVVGGLSGKSKSSKEVKEIKIKVLIRDIKSPELIINIYSGLPLKTKSDSSRTHYEKLIKTANQIKDILSIIIDNCDKKQSKLQSNAPKSDSLADELGKLFKLKEQGILTEDEFNEQKAKLLKK